MSEAYCLLQIWGQWASLFNVIFCSFRIQSTFYPQKFWWRSWFGLWSMKPWTSCISNIFLPSDIYNTWYIAAFTWNFFTLLKSGQKRLPSLEWHSSWYCWRSLWISWALICSISGKTGGRTHGALSNITTFVGTSKFQNGLKNKMLKFFLTQSQGLNY